MLSRLLTSLIKFPDFLIRLSKREFDALALPVPIAVVLLLIPFLLLDSAGARDPHQYKFQIEIGLACLAYIACVFGFLLPRLRNWLALRWLVAITNGALIPLFLHADPHFSPAFTFTLLLVIIISTASLIGRWPTYISIATFFLVFSQLPASPAAWYILDASWLISLAITTIVSTEIIVRLGNIIDNKVKRLETINKVTKVISSTIALNEVIPLLNAAIHDTLEADTHFLGLLKGDHLHLQWFYDDNEFFPETEVELKGSISAWVIANNQSLLLRNVPKEGLKIGMSQQTVGKEKMSLSWIGAPLRSSSKVIGVIALASYKLNAFQPEDLELLESVAQQAALVIENANQHSRVVEQSHRDSLTQVYNHSYFLTCLDALAEDPAVCVFSLVMLDIDYFKNINDTYGHLVGDQALLIVVDCICKNTRSSDIIGRWGGEEFVILLPNVNGSQARQVAERIRLSLNNASIQDRKGNLVPAPTASMGIAVFPIETKNTETLIHIADQRQYTAKSRGRNEIEPEASFWD